MTSNTVEMLLLTFSAATVLAVLARFEWGWVFNQPEVIRGASPFDGGRMKKKYTVELNGRRIKLIPGELRDELMSRPPTMRGDFVVMAGRLCAIDDGQDVYYGRWNMIRTAALMDIANWDFFMCCGLSIILAHYFPVEHLGLLHRTDSLILNKLMEAMFFAPFVVMGWLALRRARSIALLKRVEKVVREMRRARGFPLSDYDLRELIFKTSDLGFVFCYYILGPYVFVLAPFMFILEKIGIF